VGRIADQFAAELRGDFTQCSVGRHEPRAGYFAPWALSALITLSVMSMRGPAKTAS
jgi:hypothetical protein